MIKKIRFFLLSLIALFWFFIAIPYFLLLSSFSIGFTNKAVNFFSDNFYIEFDEISHSLKKPYEIGFKNLSLKNKSKNITYLKSDEVSLGLNDKHLFQTKNLDYLLLTGGEINIVELSNKINFNIISLNNVDINLQNKNLFFQNVSGKLENWSTQLTQSSDESKFNLKINNFNFNFNFNFNQHNIKQITLQGILKNQDVIIGNLAGQFENAFFEMDGNINTDNYLHINNLSVESFNYVKKYDDILDFINLFPKITISNLSVIESNFQKNNLIIDNINLNAKNIIYTGKWDLTKSDFIFDAESAVYFNEYFQKPIISWKFNTEEEKIIIDNAQVIWNKGEIKFIGNWKGKNLIIPLLSIKGINYQITNDFREYLRKEFKNIISRININEMIISPSLIINTNENFSFQLTNLEGIGYNLDFDYLNKIYTGQFNIQSKSATFNSLELKAPSAKIQLSENNQSYKISSYIGNGLIEADIDISAEGVIKTLSINNYYVKSDLLKKWQILDNPLDVDFYTLDLLRKPDTNTLDGILTVDQEKHYLVKNKHLIYEPDENDEDEDDINEDIKISEELITDESNQQQ